MFLSVHLLSGGRGCLLDDQCVVQVEVVPDDCQLCSCPHTLAEEVAPLWAHHHHHGVVVFDSTSVAEVAELLNICQSLLVLDDFL